MHNKLHEEFGVLASSGGGDAAKPRVPRALRIAALGQERVFSVAFHRRILAGKTPSAALRETQLEMLRSSDSQLRDPSAWGAFQLYAIN